MSNWSGKPNVSAHSLSSRTLTYAAWPLTYARRATAIAWRHQVITASSWLRMRMTRSHLLVYVCKAGWTVQKFNARVRYLRFHCTSFDQLVLHTTSTQYTVNFNNVKRYVNVYIQTLRWLYLDKNAFLAWQIQNQQIQTFYIVMCTQS